MSTTGENARTGVAVGAPNAAVDADYWRWMVAADPASYLVEPATAVPAGTVAGEGG